MTRGDFGNRGFALIVVLGTLSIIALLFAIAGTRVLARMSGTDTEMTLARTSHETRALLELTLALYEAGDGQVPTDVPLALELDDGPVVLRLQDVGGLIDLNTAAPELLDRLAAQIGLDPGALEAYRTWRRTPHRLQSTADFSRAATVDPALALRLQGVATVFSGRRGIAPEVAPEAVLELLSDRPGPRETLVSALPADWITGPSGANFEVIVMPVDKPPRSLGTIGLGTGAAKGRILEIH